MEPVTPQKRAARAWPLLAVLVVLLILLYQLRPILTPFVVGALIAYLGDPIADWLEKRGLGRGLAATLVFFVIGVVCIAVMIFMVPLLISQLNTLIHGVPVAYQWAAETVLPWLRNLLDLPEEALPRLAVRRTLTDNWQSVGKMMAAAGAYITGSSINLMVSLGNLVLIPVVAFYLLRDWDRLVPRVRNMLPLDWHAKAGELSRESDEVIGAFLRGQFLVMLSLGVIYSVGLAAIGLELAVLIGTVAGLASIVPYLGFLVGIVAAAVAAILQFQDWGVLLSVGVVFGIGQLIESYLLTPNLVGDRIGLHPVAVIFAILAGGQLAGFVGVLLALPVAAVIMVFLRHIHEYYLGTEFYGAQSEPQPGDNDAG
ncbi:MAG: AI-2E family transporter [Halieaceae bacterium]